MYATSSQQACPAGLGDCGELRAAGRLVSRSRFHNSLTGGKFQVHAGRVVMRADRRVDGLAYARASVGGDDATRAVLEICRRLDRRDINALFLSGAAISWFNIIDLVAVFEEVSRPLICLTYEESEGLEKYLREYFPEPEEKIERYRSLGMREKIRLKTGYELFVRVHGATVEEARILLNKFTLDGRVPEPVRLARMAARAARKVEEELASGSE